MKRLLRQAGHPPEKQPAAIETILKIVKHGAGPVKRTRDMTIPNLENDNVLKDKPDAPLLLKEEKGENSLLEGEQHYSPQARVMSSDIGQVLSFELLFPEDEFVPEL